jgi:hypothetical protein
MLFHAHFAKLAQVPVIPAKMRVRVAETGHEGAAAAFDGAHGGIGGEVTKVGDVADVLDAFA